jgi:hypothetical protein
LPPGCAMDRPSLSVAEVNALAPLGAWVFGHYGLSSHARGKNAHLGRASDRRIGCSSLQRHNDVELDAGKLVSRIEP